VSHRPSGALRVPFSEGGFRWLCQDLTMKPSPASFKSLCGMAMVTRDGLVSVDLAGGYADIEAVVPCTSETRFQLCSVSKQFVAVAVMLLVESGRLDLSEPVDQWLPEEPPQWRAVTLNHLLSHTSGLPHWREAAGLEPTQPMSISQRLEIIQATPLRSEPGAHWHYSSLGFLLAAFIVEQISGQPYGEFVAERILSPLQLAQTTVGGTPDAAARGYRDGQPVTPFDLDTMLGTGDIWSTASDLTRFTTALHSAELISTNSLRAMCTEHARLDDVDEGEPRLSTTGFGYAMYIGNFGGRAARYHTGDNPGYQSLACWIADRAASVVILVNDETADRTALLRQLLAVALEP
jgi:CubicO group peptidase (beta-lactamase class C family)